MFYCVCVRIHMRVHTHASEHVHALIRAHAHTVCVFMCTILHAHLSTLVHIYTHSCTRAEANGGL